MKNLLSQFAPCLFAAFAVLHSAVSAPAVRPGDNKGKPGLVYGVDWKWKNDKAAFELNMRMDLAICTGPGVENARVMSLGCIEGENLVYRHSRLSPAAVFENEGPDFSVFTDGWKMSVAKPAGAAWGDMGEFVKTKLRIAGVAVPAKDSAAETTVIAAENGLLDNKLLAFSAEGEEAKWLLAWFCHETPAFNSLQTLFVPIHQRHTWAQGSGDRAYAEWADSPQLLVFEKPVKTLVYEDGGLRIYFDGAAGKMAVVPLYGNRFLPPSETAGWRQELPEDVAKRCALLARFFRRVPMAVKETLGSAGGKAVIRNEFEWIVLDPAAPAWSPVPPALALSAKYGFPVVFKGKPEDLDMPTYHGPFAIVRESEALEYEIPDAMRYLEPVKSAAGTEAGRRNDALLGELAAEVKKLLDIPGLPAPAVCCERGIAWTRPGDLYLVLGRSYPYLPDEQKQAVLAYVRERMARVHPLQCATFAGGPPLEMTDRETGKKLVVDGNMGFLDFEVEGLMGNANMFRPSNYPAEPVGLFALYCCWKMLRHYPDAAEEARRIFPEAKKLYDYWLAQFDPVSLSMSCPAGEFGNIAHFVGGMHDRNGIVAGLIGYAQTAKLAGAAEAETAGLLPVFARELAAYVAAWRMPRFIYDAGFIRPEGRDLLRCYASFNFNIGMCPPKWEGADDDGRYAVKWGPYGAVVDVRGPFHGGNEDLHLYVFDDLTPETGRIAAELCPEEYRRIMRVIEHCGPSWFTRWDEPFLAAEQEHACMSTAWSIFNARAWTGGESYLQLCHWLDAPHYRAGDLYYIDNLVTLIEAGCQ